MFDLFLFLYVIRYNNRKQSVKFRNTQSNFINVLSGILQGSHVGALFTLVINYLIFVIRNSNTLIFVDYGKI